MNRRQFLGRGAMAAVAVSVAPAAVLAARVPSRQKYALIDKDGYWYAFWKNSEGMHFRLCPKDKSGCSYVPAGLDDIVGIEFHYVDGDTARKNTRRILSGDHALFNAVQDYKRGIESA
jgi:hypothetical protein